MQENSPKNIWHIIIGGTIGNLTEWYNFLLYGFLAPTLSKLFFPTQNKLVSLTLAFTVFALSFFARPFGGILFGWIGDNYGRQRALIISLLMMGIPTFLISILPTYHSIGILSPILLSLFRISQGLSAGGEHTGAAIYVAECAPSFRRAFWVSSVPASAALGILISSVAALILLNSFTETQLVSWGWRVGYWAGTLLCLISVLLRITLPETPYFKKTHKQNVKTRYPLSALIETRKLRNALLMVISLASSWGVFYQILFIWMPTYLTHIQNYSHNIALKINIIFILFFSVLIVGVGYIADYINRKTLIALSCSAMIISAYPLFLMLSSGSLWQVYIAIAIFTIIFSLYIPTSFVSMVEAFNTEIRYTGLSFGFNIGLAFFGGTTPLIATWLIELTKSKSAPAFYMILAAISALLTSRWIVERKGEMS